MQRAKLVTWIYLLLVFFSGALVGVFGHRLYTLKSVSAGPPPPRSPEDYRRRYLEEMRTRLKLSDDQFQKLNAIMDRTHQRFDETRQRYDDLRKAVHDEHVQSVRAMLNDEQRTEYEKMRQEREQRRKQQKSHPAP